MCENLIWQQRIFQEIYIRPFKSAFELVKILTDNIMWYFDVWNKFILTTLHFIFVYLESNMTKIKKFLSLICHDLFDLLKIIKLILNVYKKVGHLIKILFTLTFP